MPDSSPTLLESRRILLASSSPRRRELLKRLAIPFEVVVPGAECAASTDRVPERLALSHAQSKAAGAEVEHRDGLLLAVDTVVAIDGLALGKPQDRDEARVFLDRLSGRDHAVWSAHVWSAVSDGRRLPGSGGDRLVRALVRFDALSRARKAAYLDTDEWRGKAGGYAIQGAAGAFASVVEGEIETVIGLTLSLVRAEWQRFLRG